MEEMKKNTTETEEGSGETRYKITLMEDGVKKAETESTIPSPPEGAVSTYTYLILSLLFSYF